MKFRKKTDALEASRWFPPGDDRHVPNPLVNSGEGETYFVFTETGSKCSVRPGDWVVEVFNNAVQGKVVDTDTFAYAWEPVPEAAAS